MLFSPLPALTAKVGVGVNLLDPFTETPGRGPIGHVRAYRTSLDLAGMEQGYHFALGVEDEGTRIALGGKRGDPLAVGGAGPLAVVVNGQLDRPDAVVIAEERLMPGAAADSEIGCAAVLHDEYAGLPFDVEGRWVGQLLFGDRTSDLQATLDGVFERGAAAGRI